MTLDERADTILSLVDLDKKLLKDGVFEAVRLEIRAAVDESLSIGHLGEVVQGRLKRAKAEAYEKAAKMIDEDADRLAKRDGGSALALFSVLEAQKIRALAAEEGT